MNDAVTLAKELEERGLVERASGEGLEAVLKAPRKVYLGMDPSADSLHVGNLVPIILMKHLADHGHTPYLLIGGGTGLIGDPRESGERVLADESIVEKNAATLQKQVSGLIGGKTVEIFNNADWLRPLSALAFLRDVGKHFTVNQLIKREIIKKRLDAEDPISFTEFSYSLLQGFDFLHLHEQHGIDLQVGGSDQWANIVSGVELIRRKQGVEAFALTTPIIIDKATGKKFGKSEGNAVWIDPDKTSSFAFYQFWLNVSDEGVGDYLKIFTFLSLAEITEVMERHSGEPAARTAQKTLAAEMTAFIHGKEQADTAAEISKIIFDGGDIAGLSPAMRATLASALPNVKADGEIGLIDALVGTDIATSKSEARRMIEEGSVSVHDETVNDVKRTLTATDAKGGLVLLRRGKRVAIVDFGS